MAGIAFRLQKLLSGDSYSDLIRAYLYSSIISTGPFIIVIFTIAAIKLAVQVRLNIDEARLLLSLIVYVFAFSMIGVAPFMYVVTRYLADKYYLKQVKAFSPIYLSLLNVVFIIQGIAVITYLQFIDISVTDKWIVSSLYLCISGIWVAMIFISAARNYMWIVICFFVGGVVGVGASLAIGSFYGFSGFLLGFTIGQASCFFLLSFRIFNEFGLTHTANYGFFSYFKEHFSLFLVGVFYYIGIWADKFIFWFSSYGEEIRPVLRVYTNYDTPMFLAYLSVIPSMAFFLVQMETSFVKIYNAYYQSITHRANYETILHYRDLMIDNLSTNFQKYAVFQGIFSSVIILFVFEIAQAFDLNPNHMGIFRIGILGAFLQMGFLMILNIFFYYDFQKEAAMLTGLFMVCNIIFTFISLYIGFPAFGYGYAATSFVSCLVGFLALNYKLKNINYFTFMLQPVIIPKFKLESERDIKEISKTSRVNLLHKEAVRRAN
jgi:polysaccharide biosynthesis protein PelG